MSSQPVRVKTPLGEDLLFSAMELSEELARLFHCELDLLSPKEDLELDDVLGKDVTVEIDQPGGETRYFHGIVSEFAQTGRQGEYAAYTAIVRPSLWFLTRTTDCRIFQELTVPEILKDVFGEHGFPCKYSLSGTYRKWEYCVQYRETDFNFVSRLMEQEGIYYFFEYESGKHTLVLADAYGAHNPVPGCEKIPYFPPSENVVREQHVYDWHLRRSVQPGAYVLKSFHFKKPRADLKVDTSVTREHALAEYEVFDYPGEYYEKSEGTEYVRARIEELQAQHERVRGQTNVRALFPGGLFELTDYPREDQNREYLIVSTQHSLSLGDYGSAEGAEGLQYSCTFAAMYSQEPFRPERTTPKACIQGPQTAIVVGPSGEEIHTDEFGRVKVQFHWDRYGKSNENSSCWVRVASMWAGKQWGGITIPRMGQEVMVEFIEGDPDRPIVTGRVYNADNMPPYELPGNKTQSGVKSRSSKGGTPANFNEIRFEDLKGSEEMYIHAEKNQTIMVENDKAETVGHDNTESVGHDEKIDVGNNRDKTVGVDQSETIGSNKTISVGTDHTETIGANKTLTVGSNHAESIGSNMTINVGSNLTETVAINYAETVGVAMELTVGAAMTETVGASKTQTIGANKSETIGANKTVSVGKDQSETVGKNSTASIGESRNVSVAKDQTVKIGKNLVIDAGDQITIKTGSATITMKKDGTINIEGKDITIKGSGAINVKASKDVVIKGSKVLQN
jgi:type VI secretion system secreted protein VgrG